LKILIGEYTDDRKKELPARKRKETESDDSDEDESSNTSFTNKEVSLLIIQLKKEK
jgi:hypothetical protein